jgi:hypothetical protein
MTFGENWFPPNKELVIMNEASYKQKAFRAVACPNGQCVFIPPKHMEDAYSDLQTWALPVADLMLNQ